MENRRQTTLGAVPHLYFLWDGISLWLFIGQATWPVRFHGFSYLCFPPSFTGALGIWTLDPVLAQHVFYPNKPYPSLFPCFFLNWIAMKTFESGIVWDHCSGLWQSHSHIQVGNTAAARKVGRGAGAPTKGRNHKAAPMDSFLDDFKACYSLLGKECLSNKSSFKRSENSPSEHLSIWAATAPPPQQERLTQAWSSWQPVLLGP